MQIADEAAGEAIPIEVVAASNWPALSQRLLPTARAFASALGFEPKPGRHIVMPNAAGAVERVVFVRDEARSAAQQAFACGALASLLAPGRYRLVGEAADPGLAALAWLLDAYRFTRYRRDPDGPRALIVVPDDADRDRIERIASAVAFGRDLINTPANDLGPDGLEAAGRELAQRFGASVEAISGDALASGFPMIHAVGRASAIAPRLVDLRWGDPSCPKVTLVGKGVTFDTGGLDLKPEAGMALMKKDMGGAATALACARMIMGENLRLSLRVLVPAVENAVSGSSFRPGDVLASRKGPTVEIGNTDAEGRLILADALAFADEEAPDLLVDFATLTGAARVALGPDLPPLYTSDDALAAEMTEAGTRINDPVWRLPLWAPYDELLVSRVADVNNISGGPFAGSITAALFLKRFVERAKNYAHLDIYGWTPAAKPGRPQGGEVQTARLVFDVLRRRYPA